MKDLQKTFNEIIDKMEDIAITPEARYKIYNEIKNVNYKLKEIICKDTFPEKHPTIDPVKATIHPDIYCLVERESLHDRMNCPHIFTSKECVSYSVDNFIKENFKNYIYEIEFCLECGEILFRKKL